MADEVAVGFSLQAVRESVFSSNASVQARFQAEFPDEVNRAVRAIASAHRGLDYFRARAPQSLQSATLELFLHSAVNSVLVSVHHLVSGFPIAAGNMMRHYTESVAMALLCLDPNLGVLARFSDNRRDYPVHHAPTKLRQRKVRAALKKRIEFDSQAWETVLEISELYDQLSHASAFALAHQIFLEEENLFILGSEYDPAKRDAYRSELVRRATAAESLTHLIDVITDRVAAAPHK